MSYLGKNFELSADESFTVWSDKLDMKEYNVFDDHLNFEITLLENCMGKRFIGDHVGSFNESDLVLLGSYLPHSWQCYPGENEQTPMAHVIHFSPDFMGNELLEKPEAKELKALFHHAARGILFSVETVHQARVIIYQMLKVKGLERMVLMLELLKVLACSTNSVFLASSYFNMMEKSPDGYKIALVMEYLYDNFKGDIFLDDVAKIASLSGAAFCRFFKSKTNRTFNQFVKDVRISHAAKLLLAGTHNVSEACYNSGYNNLSNFNKHFKEIKGLPPTLFLKRSLGC